MVGIKLKFNNTEYTVNDAVSSGLIQPLVLISSSAASTSYGFKNVNNLLSGENSSGNYPWLHLFFKVKNTQLQSFIFNSNSNFTTTTWDGIAIYKLKEGTELWIQKP